SRLFCVAASRLNSPRFPVVLIRRKKYDCQARGPLTRRERGQARLPDPETITLRPLMRGSHNLEVGKAGLPPLFVFGIPKLDTAPVFWLNANVSQRSSLSVYQNRAK